MLGGNQNIVASAVRYHLRNFGWLPAAKTATEVLSYQGPHATIGDSRRFFFFIHMPCCTETTNYVRLSGGMRTPARLAIGTTHWILNTTRG